MWCKGDECIRMYMYYQSLNISVWNNSSVSLYVYLVSPDICVVMVIGTNISNHQVCRFVLMTGVDHSCISILTYLWYLHADNWMYVEQYFGRTCSLLSYVTTQFWLLATIEALRLFYLHGVDILFDSHRGQFCIKLECSHFVYSTPNIPTYHDVRANTPIWTLLLISHHKSHKAWLH